VNSHEFRAKRFPVEIWDIRGNEINEEVNSFSWAGQEEEIWWKIKIVVGEYQWVVSL
jgi:hypothetical protein